MESNILLLKFDDGVPADICCQAVHRVLGTVPCRGPDEHGTYVATLSDGVEIGITAPARDSRSVRECTCHVPEESLSDPVSRFIYQLARAGDMAILAPMDEYVMILTGPHQKQYMPAEFVEDHPETILCESAEDLVMLLAKGYKSWKGQRRDSVAPAAATKRHTVQAGSSEWNT
jgi:hypothetical protein